MGFDTANIPYRYDCDIQEGEIEGIKYINLKPVESLSRFASHDEIPTAKAVYDAVSPKAQVVHLNSFWNEHEEGGSVVLTYDHGDVTGTGLKAILDAGNIPYLNVYINTAEDGEEPQWLLYAEAVYGGCMKDEDGNISISDFRLNYQFLYDISLIFTFNTETGEVDQATGMPFYLMIQDFVQNNIESAIPSVSEINGLFNE